jgi:Ser-tRNA(Ala) deacylase AlaX
MRLLLTHWRHCYRNTKFITRKYNNYLPLSLLPTTSNFFRQYTMASITTEKVEEDGTTVTTPPTKPLYLGDTYMFEKNDIQFVEMRKVGEDETKIENVVITESTIFHPQGGGQPSDTGVMKQGDVEFKVTKVAKAGLFENDVIYHYGEFTSTTKEFDTNEPIHQIINEEERRRNARVHSAGHLLDQAMRRAGKGDMIGTKGFHFPAGSYVEFLGSVAAEDRAQLIIDLQKHCDELIAESIDTVVKSVQDEKELCDNCLPGSSDGAITRLTSGPVRVVIVGGELGCPCGGTHVKNTNEIKKMSIRKLKVKKGRTKISYDVEP